MKQLHETQLAILKKLLFSPELRYTDLKPNHKMDNNQFDFHLDKMIDAGHIEKVEGGYALSSAGKEYANRIDTDVDKIIKQAKIGAFICSTRDYEGQKQYLIYTRHKHPFYGCQGFPAGKVNFGEAITDAAQREFKEETNLDGDAKLVMIKHYRVYDTNTGNLLEDKFLHLCHIHNPQGNLVGNNEGVYSWINESDLKKYVTNHFTSWDDFMTEIEAIKNFTGEVKFLEVTYKSEKF